MVAHGQPWHGGEGKFSSKGMENSRYNLQLLDEEDRGTGRTGNGGMVDVGEVGTTTEDDFSR